MFGIGPMEMGIIAVVALLIFGPEKLPEMMGQAGKMVRDFRKMTTEMSGEFEKTIAEAKGLTKEFQGEVGSMQRQVSSVTSSIQKDLGGGKKSTTSKSTTATKRSSSSGAKKSGTSSGGSSTARKGSSTSKASSSSSASAKASTSTSKTATATKPAVPQQATREDPTAAVSLFEPSAPRREKRARSATLAAFGEATPRTAPAVADEAMEANGAADSAGSLTPPPIDLNDPLARARQRRQSAGYARKIS